MLLVSDEESGTMTLHADPDTPPFLESPAKPAAKPNQTAAGAQLAAWRRDKRQVPGALLFWRRGGYYYLLNGDAEAASRVLGVPIGYRWGLACAWTRAALLWPQVQALILAGHRVAVSEPIDPMGPRTGPRLVVELTAAD